MKKQLVILGLLSIIPLTSSASVTENGFHIEYNKEISSQDINATLTTAYDWAAATGTMYTDSNLLGLGYTWFNHNERADTFLQATGYYGLSNTAEIDSLDEVDTDVLGLGLKFGTSITSSRNTFITLSTKWLQHSYSTQYTYSYNSNYANENIEATLNQFTVSGGITHYFNEHFYVGAEAGFALNALDYNQNGYINGGHVYNIDGESDLGYVLNLNLGFKI